MSYARELLWTARHLLLGQNGEMPSRADCNRAASTIYYALFDFICSAIADRIAGQTKERSLPSKAWDVVYRSIDHAALEAALFRVIVLNTSDEVFSKFLAITFKRARDERIKADYNRAQDVDLDAAKQLLSETENAIMLVESPDGLDANGSNFGASDWLSSLIVELFFSKSKR